MIKDDTWWMRIDIQLLREWAEAIAKKSGENTA